MKQFKRCFALLMSFVLLISAVEMTSFASVVDFINITGGSEWKGSVFGDVGGQDKITADNFNISENADGTVTLGVKNNRGKIAGSSEGIAYYYQEIPKDTNFELTATVQVDAWEANNQVSFGLMLRGEVLDNESGSHTSDYVALGALDQVIKGFYKYKPDTSIQKNNNIFNNEAPPTEGATYQLGIKKVGSTIVLQVGDEIQILDNYTGQLNYAGLFAARNTTVTFSNVKMVIDTPIELDDDWTFSAFGSNTSITERNFDPNLNADGSVTIEATGGKISSTDDGLSFYFKEVPTRANFEIKATAKVHEFVANNQVSFGLMLRDEVGVHGDSSGHQSDYIAIGALDQTMKTFHKENLKQTKGDVYGEPLLVDGEYDLSIKKSGDTYVLTLNGESQTITLDDLFDDTMFAGFYVARGTKVTFSNFEIKVDNRKVVDLIVDTSGMKTEYLVGEDLDLDGIKVTVVFDNASTEELSIKDLIVTGFNSEQLGINTFSINYNGVVAKADVEIVPLTVTGMRVKYYPAKTDYYKGDVFSPDGLVINATYNNGYKVVDLDSDQYELTFEMGSTTASAIGFVFADSGTKTVTVRSTETTSAAITFTVNVLDAELQGIEIRQAPLKDRYFIGDELDLDGMAVYALYDNNAQVRLMKDEYTVSNLDTSVPGDNKEVLITHKGKTASLYFDVKVKELKAIEVTGYPKTTFYVGEVFNSQGLEVSKVFDNGDKEVLNISEYTVDDSGFESGIAGVYSIKVIPQDTTIQSVTYDVTVREKANYEWKFIRFGQSISTARNNYEERSNSVWLQALEGGGKVTGDHDGISFYYVELDAEEDNFTLSADIRVAEYAKDPHDGQESFGIMARDAIGAPNDSAVFASNIAAIGGYSGGTTERNGTQLIVRTGVESSDGAGSLGVQKIMLNTDKPKEDNTYPVQDYKLTLSKTNSGYTGKLNDGNEELFFEPDILRQQDGKMYVGFYTARLATIEVFNIDLVVTAAATDAPKVEKPAEAIKPSIDVVSLNKTSETDYTLMLKANVDGTVTIKEGQKVIVTEGEVTKGEIFEVVEGIAKNADTDFSITFLPNDTQFLTSYNKIVRNFTVTNKVYAENGDIYVSTDGTSAGDGTIAKPLDLDTAIDFVRPGQKIIVQKGHYIRNSKLEIKKFNDGTSGAMKSLVAESGAGVGDVVIDFDKRSEGAILSGNFWHIKGIDFARTQGNTKGFVVGGSDNLIEECRFYENGDTGLQISRTDVTENDKTKWPSRNIILNVTSFDNRDPSDNNADGFAAKLTSGYGNKFIGCIAHNNIDDGWDLYTKVGTGEIGPVMIINSVAYNNGYLTDGTVGSGDKNGFKLGGEGVYVPHVIENSVAFGNLADGFTSNSNPGVIAINNIGFNNKRNIGFTTYTGIQRRFEIEGFISYHYNNELNPSSDSIPTENRNDTNFIFNGSESVNASGIELTTSNFNNLIMPVEVKRIQGGAPGESNVDFSFLQYDPTGSQNPATPQDPTAPENPIETPDGAIFFDDFENATTDTIFTTGYRVLPVDASVPMYVKTGGNVTVENGTIKLDAGRMTVGAKSNIETTDSTTPGGAFDLIKPYRIVMDVVSSNGDGNFQVYVDNNTTSAGKSVHGTSSKVYEVKADEIPVGQLVIDLELGTEESFIQLRTSSGAVIIIDSLMLKYLEDEEPIDENPDNDDADDDADDDAPDNDDAGDSGSGNSGGSGSSGSSGSTSGSGSGNTNSSQDDKSQVEETTQTEGKDTTSQSSELSNNVLVSSSGVKITTEKVRYINGYTDGTVKPDSEMTREEVVSLLYQLVVNDDKGKTDLTKLPFIDVSANSWAITAIAYFKNKGIILGGSDGTFKPKESITRAEFLTILSHFAPDVQVDGIYEFSDSKDHWASEFILKAKALGWVSGYPDGSFKPDQAISRAEVITIMNRVLGRIPQESSIESPFSDLSTNHWAYSEIIEATK
jgi:lipopolysaccharide export system protein LptA